jgi:beta-glucosidase
VPPSKQTTSPAASGERDLAARVRALTLEQKVRLLTGADAWSLHSEPEIGLRRLVVSDGPAGVRGERWDERDPSANVPSPTALAATWDEELVEDLGRLLASEARRKNVDVLLAPTVNLHRTPYGGRHFECFSEDPLLTARIGCAYVRGVQAGGVAATVKHFVANDSETQRMSVDVRVDRRALRELYLAPFEALVREAGAWAVMAAYNGVEGATMTESPLLGDVLKREWGFDGLVMSDWFATRSTTASARAALDLVMPGPGGPWGAALVDAVRDGTVPEEAIDDKVMRILRLAARVGALDGASGTPALRRDDADVAATLRRAAAAGFVLVRNDRGLLPLQRSELKQIAVIGPNAAVARTLGGGSATVFPPYTVSPLAGLRAALAPGVQIDHSIGVLASGRIPVAAGPWLHSPDRSGPGIEVRFVAGDGTVLATERRLGGALRWDAVPRRHPGATRVEVHAVLRATDTGTHAVGCSGIGRYRLSVGGEEVFDGNLELPPGADIVEGMMIPPQAVWHIHLRRGEEAEVVLAHELGPDRTEAMGVGFQLNLQPPHGTDEEEIERAASIASEADVAVVVVGTTEEVESEGFDRASLSLPGRQDELVRRVAAANPSTVVVVNAGAPVLLPWTDEVAAVLLAWFPGQEFGNALADVLLGRGEPGGRLPTTWPRSEDGLPKTQPAGGALRYEEGLFVGYRGYDRDGRAPMYPFGYGLGYTTWAYLSIEVPQEAPAGTDVDVSVTVRNTGVRRGREVLQVYASRPGSDVERPLRWLVGYAAVDADPNEQITASITVRSRAFEHFDAQSGRWGTEPGAFRLAAGASCEALPLWTETLIGAPTESRRALG